MISVMHDQLLAEVIKLCDKRGLLWHYCGDSRRCRGPRGFPDLVITSYRGIIFAELKSADGETTANQDQWSYTLTHAIIYGGDPVSGNIRYVEWRPDDLQRLRIELELDLLGPGPQ